MSSWGNSDAPGNKPKFNPERQVRQVIQLVTANTTNAGNTNVTFTTNAAAAGVTTGQWVYAAGLGANGRAGFFTSNNSVTGVSLPSGNNIQFGTAAWASIPAGTIIEFDKSVVYDTGSYEVTYNADTVLITETRAANANTSQAQIGNVNVGWNHIRKKTNSDGTVRYLKETLVALAKPSASNLASGNTSTGSVFNGL